MAALEPSGFAEGFIDEISSILLASALSSSTFNI